jgi:membrane-associated phospholipid phosphatase
MAAGTAYARSYTDHHWFSDVVAGAAISVPVSRSLVRYYENDHQEESGLSVVPGINGVTLLWKF